MSTEVLSAAEFRRRLAGLEDPNKKLPEMEMEAIKDETVKFLSFLPTLYSDQLDRMDLWERIGDGIISAVNKCGGDWELFTNLMLEFIKAEPGKVASSQKFLGFIETMALRPKEWHEAFLRRMRTRSMVDLVKARAVWNLNKNRNTDLPEASE